MSNSIIKKVKITKADYDEELQSIFITGECDFGMIRQEHHSSMYSFGTRDVHEEMRKLAEIMVGKYINIEFLEEETEAPEEKE